MNTLLKNKPLTVFSQIFDEKRLNDEEPKEPQPEKEVKEVLNLNERLIMTLEKADKQIQDANKQIEALNQLNVKLNADVQAKHNELLAYKQAEEKAKQARYDTKLNDVHFKWCEAFSLKDTEKQEEAKRMLSTFSEDKLETIKASLDNKATQMSDSPQPVTKYSEELAQPEEEEKPVTAMDIEKMSAEEKKAYTNTLYEKLVKSIKK